MQRSNDGQAFRRVTLVAAGIAALCMALAFALAPKGVPSPLDNSLARYLFVHQDLPFGLVVTVLWLLVFWRPSFSNGAPQAPRSSFVALTSAAAMVLLCWGGARSITERYDFSRDEQMASFDAIIFAGGKLFATIPAAARATAAMFNQTFILPIGDHEAWVSAYLPMNAAIRAIFLMLGDARLEGPTLVGLGALALWRISVQLWPRSPASQIVALTLYVGSSQIWLTAMTAYAMTAHLALNLIWLWLFLKDRRWSHAAAIAVGGVATGLHQPVFHPLFIMPFLIMLAATKRWRLLTLYSLAYTAIGLFWLGWPLWISAHGTAPAAISQTVHGVGYGERLLHIAAGFRPDGVGMMAANLIRFVTWQHLLLVPLAGFGAYKGWKADPLIRALVLGLIFPVFFLLIIMPYQGHGWGYRYLHGVIGNACLLGGYGWCRLESKTCVPARAMIAATIASLAIALPLHALMVHQMVAPVAAAAAARDAAGADYVVVDDTAAPFAQDLVINRPALDNRPLILSGSVVSVQTLSDLCRHGSVAFMDASRLGGLSRAFGGQAPKPTPAYAGLEEAARAVGCRVAAIPE